MCVLSNGLFGLHHMLKRVLDRIDSANHTSSNDTKADTTNDTTDSTTSTISTNNITSSSPPLATLPRLPSLRALLSTLPSTPPPFVATAPLPNHAATVTTVGGGYLILDCGLPALTLTEKVQTALQKEEKEVWLSAARSLQADNQNDAVEKKESGEVTVGHAGNKDGEWKALKAAGELLIHILAVLPVLTAQSLTQPHPGSSTSPAHAAQAVPLPFAFEGDLMRALFHPAASIAWHQSRAQSVLLSESLTALLHVTPPRWRLNGFAELRSLVSRVVETRLSMLGDSAVTTSLAIADDQLTVVMDELKSRERKAVQTAQNMQLRRLLHALLPKLYSLHKYLENNATPTPQQQQQIQHQQSTTARTQVGQAVTTLLASPPLGAFYPLPTQQMLAHMYPLCGGVFPDKIAEDRFTCNDCAKRTDHQFKVVKTFVSKYASDPTLFRDIHQASLVHARTGGDVSGTGGGGFVFGLPGVVRQLNMKDDAVINAISDYVVSHAYKRLFVECPTADYRNSVDLSVIRQIFPTWASFYLHINSPPSREADIELMRPFVKAIEDDAKTESLPADQRPTTSRVQEASRDVGLSALKHPNAHKVPYLGETTLLSAVIDLRRFINERSCKAKLKALASLRQTLSQVLQTSTLAMLPPSAPGSSDYPTPHSAGGSMPFEFAHLTYAAKSGIHTTTTSLSTLGATPQIPEGSPHTPAGYEDPTWVDPGSLRLNDSAGSAEDYMFALCYVIITTQPKNLLST